MTNNLDTISKFASSEAIINPLMESAPLDPAEPFSADAMAPHREFLHKLLDAAVDNPGAFLFSLIVVGKDGESTVSHGTMSPVVAALVVNNVLNPIEKIGIGKMLNEFGGFQNALAFALSTQASNAEESAAYELQEPSPVFVSIEDILGAMPAPNEDQEEGECCNECSEYKPRLN